MTYDASGQKPASTNGFDPGVEVCHITGDPRGIVAETNLGKFKNEVRLQTAIGYARYFQTALSIIDPAPLGKRLIR